MIITRLQGGMGNQMFQYALEKTFIKAESLLGWSPMVKLEEGIGELKKSNNN